MAKPSVFGSKGRYGLNAAVVCLVCNRAMEISFRGAEDHRALFLQAEATHIHSAGHSPEARVFVMEGNIERQVSKAIGLYGVAETTLLLGLDAFK